VESHRQIEDEAALLLAKRDSGEWSGADETQLARWLSGSTARRVAFLRLEAVWEDARRLKALGAGLPPQTVPAIGELQRAPFFDPGGPVAESPCSGVAPDDAGGSEPSREFGVTRPLARGFERSSGRARSRKAWVAWSAAAAILATVGMSAYFHISDDANRYSTPIGGLASVPLRDGSNITLNTTTQIRVHYTAAERRIRLDRGEAFFSVTKDPHRPFVVEVGNERIVAVGTQFSVRRDGDDIRVEVTEGRVRVERPGTLLPSRSAQMERIDGVERPDTSTPSAPTRDVEPEALILTSGGIAQVSNEGVVVQERSATAVEDDLSWRQGYLTFHDAPLAEVVAQLNRYNTHKIRIDDAKLATVRITGSFRTRNYESFVRLMGQGFGIKANRTEEETVLTR
jgi:transmembrane sensor